MNLQEAIFRRSNLEDRKQQLYSELQNYKSFPYELGGKPADNSKEEKKVEKILEEINAVEKEYLDYSAKINKANYENGILEKIAEVKILRDKINQYRYYLPGEFDDAGVKVIEGVGMVKSGPIKEDKIREELSKLNKEAERLSLEIDKLNQNTEI